MHEQREVNIFPIHSKMGSVVSTHRKSYSSNSRSGDSCARNYSHFGRSPVAIDSGIGPMWTSNHNSVGQDDGMISAKRHLHKFPITYAWVGFCAFVCVLATVLQGVTS